MAVSCAEAIATQTEIVISAATLAEAFIVARRYGILARLEQFLDQIPIKVIAADEDTAARVSEIHAKWGKKHHPALLNIVDCFSYDVAREHHCPLLYIGNDFAQTDIQSAL